MHHANNTTIVQNSVYKHLELNSKYRILTSTRKTPVRRLEEHSEKEENMVLNETSITLD